jgi:ABC-type glycerol-3-phosphate transport system substrate-binding protein
MSKILTTTAVAIALSLGLGAIGSASALATDYHTEYDAHPGYEGAPIGYEPQQSVTPEFNNPGPQLSVPYTGDAVDQLSPLMGAGQPDALGIK